MKWKKATHVVTCGMVLSLIITGCSSGSGGDTSKGEGSKGASKEQVTISFWFPGADKTNDDYFSNAAKEFEKSHPNIKVETTVLPANSSDVDTKLNAAKLSGNYPDVFSSYLIYMGTRGSKNEFAPLDDYINKWEGKSDMFENALGMGKLKDKTIGLGFFAAPELLVYRKDFFQEAGLDPQKPPTNWDELAQYAEKLTKRDGSGNVTRAGFDIPLTNASVFFEPFMRQNGAAIVDEQKEAPVFNDPKSVEAFKFLADLAAKKVNIPYNYQKKDEIPFMNGKSAMSYLQPTQILSLQKNNPDMKDKLGFAPVLKKEKQVDFSGYRLFTIGNTSKNKDAAWQFIDFMMSKDEMWKRYQELKIPVVRKSLEAQFTKEDPVFNSVLLEYIKNGKGKPVVSWASLYDKYIHLAYEETMFGKKPAEQALKDAQTALEQEIKNIK